MIKQVVYRRTNSIIVVNSKAPTGYVYNNWNYNDDNYNSVSSSFCSIKQRDTNPTEQQ
jgi:hypothetical protein